MEVISIPTSKIKIGDNSRAKITDHEMTSLMASIKETGLLQPIGVAKDGKNYTIVFGNRRFIAMKKLGWEEIPAIEQVIDNDYDTEIKNLTENIQRSDVTLVEIGRYIEHLKVNHKLKNGEIAVRLGKSPNFIKTAVEAYTKVPTSFRSAIEIKHSNDRSTTPGMINLSAANTMIKQATRHGLNKKQVEKLFTEAKTNEDFKPAAIKKYAAAIKAGSEEPVKDVGIYKSISVQIVIKESEYERLYKEHITNGPFKSFSSLIFAVLRGEKTAKMKIEKRQK